MVTHASSTDALLHTQGRADVFLNDLDPTLRRQLKARVDQWYQIKALIEQHRLDPYVKFDFPLVRAIAIVVAVDAATSLRVWRTPLVSTCLFPASLRLSDSLCVFCVLLLRCWLWRVRCVASPNTRAPPISALCFSRTLTSPRAYVCLLREGNLRACAFDSSMFVQPLCAISVPFPLPPASQTLVLLCMICIFESCRRCERRIPMT